MAVDKPFRMCQWHTSGQICYAAIVSVVQEPSHEYGAPPSFASMPCKHRPAPAAAPTSWPQKTPLRRPLPRCT